MATSTSFPPGPELTSTSTWPVERPLDEVAHAQHRATHEAPSSRERSDMSPSIPGGDCGVVAPSSIARRRGLHRGRYGARPQEGAAGARTTAQGQDDGGRQPDL